MVPQQHGTSRWFAWLTRPEWISIKRRDERLTSEKLKRIRKKKSSAPQYTIFLLLFWPRLNSQPSPGDLTICGPAANAAHPRRRASLGAWGFIGRVIPRSLQVNKTGSMDVSSQVAGAGWLTHANASHGATLSTAEDLKEDEMSAKMIRHALTNDIAWCWLAPRARMKIVFSLAPGPNNAASDRCLLGLKRRLSAWICRPTARSALQRERPAAHLGSQEFWTQELPGSEWNWGTGGTGGTGGNRRLADAHTTHTLTSNSVPEVGETAREGGGTGASWGLSPKRKLWVACLLACPHADEKRSC